MFERKGIAVQTTVIEETDRGPILEISFKGIHDHHWPYGREIRNHIEEEVRRTNPAAILFNFMEYHYEWGNEIGDPFMSAVLDTENRILRPFAVVAEGITAKRLKSLFRDGCLDRVMRFEFFEDLNGACSFLRGIIGAISPT